MAIALVTSGAAGSADTGTAVSPNRDTSLATFLAVWVSWYATGGGAVADSLFNTWTGLTQQTNGGGFNAGRWWYAANPSVGVNHNVTFTQLGSYPSIYMLAFSGVKTVTPFDQENGATGSTYPLSTGSITPSENGELVLAGLSSFSTGTYSIDNGFTITDSFDYAPSVYIGGAAAYKIQTTAAAVNPAWSQPNNNPAAAAIASFKAAAVAGVVARGRMVRQAVNRAATY